MDIALELCDTFIFDHLYASLLPAQPAQYNLKDGVSNSTLFDATVSSPWQYHAASKFVSFEPSEAAYMSQWPRDNVYRQLFSLFLITW
jgi:lathosterol oxidase